MAAYWLWPYALAAALIWAFCFIAGGRRRRVADRNHELRIWERTTGRAAAYIAGRNR